MFSLHAAIEFLEADEQFKEWKKNHSDSYLCHCMQLLDDKDAWHIGYYNKDDTITTFVVTEKIVDEQKADEIFKETSKAVRAIEFDRIELTAEKAVEVAKKLCVEKYSQEVLSKHILILQHLEVGHVYNVTFVTLSMSTLNVKIDSASGDVLEHKRTTLADFKQG